MSASKDLVFLCFFCQPLVLLDLALDNVVFPLLEGHLSQLEAFSRITQVHQRKSHEHVEDRELEDEAHENLVDDQRKPILGLFS